MLSHDITKKNRKFRITGRDLVLPRLKEKFEEEESFSRSTLIYRLQK